MTSKKYVLTDEAPQCVYMPSSAEQVQRNKLPYAERIAESMELNIISLDENELVFDLVGVDVSLANALRRIMLAEVPTMAIENLYVVMNSSIIHDEVLAHRVGLVPINADPRRFEDFVSSGDANEYNTIVFKLEKKADDFKQGTKGGGAGGAQGGAAASRLSREDPPTTSVYSRDLEWVPVGRQQEHFPDGIAPVHDDILLAKLRPGQEITFEAHCHKGTGHDHAKFSPVSNSSYRLLPVVKIVAPGGLTEAESEELVAKCPMKVFDIEDSVAVVARPRDCTMCRECIREGDWGEKVTLERDAEHFIFTVESMGMMPPQDILRLAIAVLKDKCNTILGEVDQFQSSANLDEVM